MRSFVPCFHSSGAAMDRMTFQGLEFSPVSLSLIVGAAILILVVTLNSGSGSSSKAKKSTKPKGPTKKLPKQWQWRKEGLSQQEVFERASSAVPVFGQHISKDEGLKLYGYFKQGTAGDINIPEPGMMDQKGKAKWQAWNKVKGTDKDTAQKEYVKVVDSIVERLKDFQEEEYEEDTAVLYPVKIAGVGRYLPRHVVTNDVLEEKCKLEKGWVEAKNVGIKTRHWADLEKETTSFMGAKAAKEAVADAGLKLQDIDCIISACGTPERAVPDTSALLQREMGLGDSGIPCFSVHCTCLGFMIALDTAASHIANGRYKNILCVSSEIPSCGLNFDEPDSAVLLGDGAGAVVLTLAEKGESSCIHRSALGTYGVGADLTTVYGGGTYRHPNNPKTTPKDNMFHMDGGGIMKLVFAKGREFLESVRPGLSKGLGDIQMIVPHQPSAVALQGLEHYGWPRDKILRTIETCGNCVAASIPITLYMAVKEKKLINRGDKVMICGTGAGLTLGCIILTY